MNKNVAPSGQARDAGTTYRGIHTDPGSTADAPAARHTQQVMQKPVAPSGSSAIAVQRGTPNY